MFGQICFYYVHDIYIYVHIFFKLKRQCIRDCLHYPVTDNNGGKQVMQMKRVCMCILSILPVAGMLVAGCLSAASEMTETDVLEVILEQSDIDSRDYKLGIYDCNEFSDDLEAELLEYDYRVGQASILSNNTSDIGHRFLWINIGNTILFIEPQTDKLYGAEELYGAYGAKFRFNKLLLYNFNNETLCFYVDNIGDVNELV